MFQIDHLGIAVKSLDAAKSIYEKLGLSVSPEETVEQEKVRLVMVPVGDSRLALLEKHGHSKSDLGAFAVASGPGSFTGLRVGLAAIKALAEALRKPIAAVSLLEAVARSGAARETVLAALDAGRGDEYVGDYELDAHVPTQVRMRSERLLSREEFVAEARGKSVVTPDAQLADALRAAGIPVERIEYPNSAMIARLGWEHLQRGQTVRPEDLEANYIRRSDAEVFSKPKP